MHQTINFYDFRRGFEDCGRSGNFSYEGLEALFNHFEEMEADQDESIEFDPIAICCEYTEYDSAKAAMSAYVNIEEYGDIDEEDALDWLNDRTFVLECDNGHIVIQDF